MLLIIATARVTRGSQVAQNDQDRLHTKLPLSDAVQDLYSTGQARKRVLLLQYVNRTAPTRQHELL